MSNRTVVRTTRGAAIPVSRSPAKQIAKVQPKGGESFLTMQQNMELELDRRRQDWEKEVEKMQADFFKMKPSQKAVKSSTGDEVAVLDGEEEYEEEVPVQPMPVNLRPPGAEIIDVNNSKNLYHQRADGTRYYRLCFDVRGFEPHEVNVQVDGDKLKVSAQHEEESQKGSKLNRHFNRAMDIPEDVMGDEIEAVLSPDGILAIEAPVDPNAETANQQSLQGFALGAGPVLPILPKQTSSHSRSVVRGSHYRPREGDPYPELGPSTYTNNGAVSDSMIRVRQIPDHSPGTRTVTRYSNPLVVIVDDQRKLKLAVDIGTGYTEDDVCVKLKAGKICVYALREEEEPWHKKREFSREYDLPEEIEPTTVRAALTQEGRIMIGASCAENTDHDAVLASIDKDIPPDAVRLTIDYE